MTPLGVVEKQFSPFAERTKERVCDALRPHLPVAGTVLELASGSGQHIAFLAEAFPDLTWIPSDISDRARTSIAIWTRSRPNVMSPIALDVAQAEWPVEPELAAIVAIELLHLLSTTARDALFSQARSVLAVGAPLCAITAVKSEGAPSAPRPAAHLAAWSVVIDPPTISELSALAARHGFALASDATFIETQRVLVFR